MLGENLLEGLNERQKEAVMHLEGPLLILAGAGSGKTRVITMRAMYLMEQGVAPWNILAITFTNKAAAEMRERVDALLGGERAKSIWVSTFHAMCVRLLRSDIEKLGYGRDFVIYDADDQRTLIKRCIKKLNLDTKIYRERALLGLISTAKNDMVNAAGYAEAAADFYDRNAAKVYAEYEKELKANNALDFDDLLLLTVELFNKYPEVLEHWRERFKYIMVDEYQDTNNVQFELVRLLAGYRKNLCVVGDDDQSIYKFRGANINNILDFEKTFPGAKVIKLEQNYRSTKSILNAANAVIRNNKGRKIKSLWTKNHEGKLPDYHEYDTAAGEAEAIIIKAASNAAHGLSYRKQAVLYRTNAQSRLLEEKCISRNVPYIIVGGVNFYQRKEIKDVLSYLRVIGNGSDDLSALRIINVPKRGIGLTSSGRISEYASAMGISFYEAAERAGSIPGLGSAQKRIRLFTDFIEELRTRLKAGQFSLKGLINAIVEESGYKDELEKDDPVSAETRLENIEELVNKAADFEKSFNMPENPDGGAYVDLLLSFLEDVSLVADIDRTDDSDDVLTMMTLHAAKGLEFDTVFISGMEEGLFPSAASINSDNPEEEIEEERRLCYVGLTRAMENLHLSSARERMVNGEMHYMKASRFISEIPDAGMEKHFRAGRDEGRPAFSGFGGIEGAFNREESYGFENRFAPERSSGEKAYSAYNSFQENTYGRFGSLDTKRPSRGTGGRYSLDGISGLKKGFGIGTGGGGAAVKQKPDYGVGDTVEHIKFGKGKVTDISDSPKDYKVTVDFEGAGTKVMYAGFAKLKKV